MRAFVIVVLALTASAPVFLAQALAQDDDEDSSAVRSGDQAIWNDGTVTPIFRDDPGRSAIDSDDRTDSDRNYAEVAARR